MQILPDQSCEHVMVDAADNTTSRDAGNNW